MTKVTSILVALVALIIGGCLWFYQVGTVVEKSGGLNNIAFLDLFGVVVFMAAIAFIPPMAEFVIRRREVVKFTLLMVLFGLLVAGTAPNVIARYGEK